MRARRSRRGVRVRLLLDDNLDAHPNIEVRLFNPFPHRDARWVGFLTDFSRPELWITGTPSHATPRKPWLS